MMRVMFQVNSPYHSLISIAICVATWSKVSHCELVFSDGAVLNSEPGKGVHYLTVQSRAYDRYNWIEIPLPWIGIEAESRMRAYANSIVEHRLGYDYLGAILGGLFGCQNSLEFFCSELVATILSDVIPVIDTEKWYSPKGLWKELARYYHLQCGGTDDFGILS